MPQYLFMFCSPLASSLWPTQALASVLELTFLQLFYFKAKLLSQTVTQNECGFWKT